MFRDIPVVTWWSLSIWYTSHPSPHRGQDFPRYLFPEAYFLDGHQLLVCNLKISLGEIWNWSMYTQGIEWVLSHLSYPILATLWTVAPPGSSVYEILQARILEWVASSFSRGSSWLRDQTQVSHISDRFYHVHHQGSLCTWKARRDQRKSQSTPNQYMPDLKSKGTYMKALSWVTSRGVDPHTHPPEY